LQRASSGESMTLPDGRTANILLTIPLFAAAFIIIYLARRSLFFHFVSLYA
jgi:hypothetical protein